MAVSTNEGRKRVGLLWGAVGAVPAAVGVSGQHAVLTLVAIVGAARHVQLDQFTVSVDVQLLLWHTQRSE